MGKTLVTGGTGFVGSHLVRALAERGDELRLLARSSARVGHLGELDYDRAIGSVTDRSAVRKALKGVDRVFHVAGRTSLRREDSAAVYRVNVQGTQTVLEEAHRAGVERVVCTSSVAAIGPSVEGRLADETQTFEATGVEIPYVLSKHQAEVEALRIASHGLDVVFVNPTYVLGPEAPGSGSSMSLVRRFMLGRIPVYVDGGLNVVDVRDVAAGHLLADRKGETGERYILGGRNFSLHRLFCDLARIAGIDPPPLRLPASVVRAGAAIGDRYGVALPLGADEARSAAQWWTYSNRKAKAELGFAPRPHEETLNDAVEWQLAELDGAQRAGGVQRALLGAAGRAVGRIATVGRAVVER